MPVQMKLSRIILNEINDQQLIYLKEVGGDRQFAILIGTFEARSIDMRVKKFQPPRPQTHDLLVNAIEQMGGELDYVRDLGNPGQVSVPFVLDPDSDSHQLLYTLKTAGDNIGWMICLAEATTDPTINSSGDLVAPAGRTSFAFDGYVSDITIEIATNEVARGTLVIQRSGVVTPTWYEGS